MNHQIQGSVNGAGTQKHFYLANFSAPERIYNLTAGQSWKVQGKHRQQTIFCLEGSIWVTQECDIHDYVLDEGDAFVITSPGLVLVRALKPSRFGYAESLTPVLFK